MSAPQLSIVVPVYNGIRYLQDTLDSLIQLEHAVYCEFIFQNCQSTDGTTAVLDAFCRGHENRFHCNEQDSGQSDAINKGTGKAKGNWVTWLCADDVILPAVGQALRAGDIAGADVVYGDIIFVEGSAVYPAIGTESHSPGALSRRRLIIQQPGTCIRRKVWQDAGGVDVQLNWSMDYDLFLRLESKNKRFLRVDSFLAVIRVHPDAKTSSGSIRRVFELWAVLKNSHLRRPGYFSLRPYAVYGMEYLIKAIESKPRLRSFFPVRILLRGLHNFFWRVAGPMEQVLIQDRFARLPQTIVDLTGKLAG